MGGKSYYCDYCCCYMKNDLNVRKLHNAGISHTAAKATYMRRFENPRKILIEERKKKPCKRFFAGFCKFQLLCSFGHYSEQHLKQLEKIVIQLKKQRCKKIHTSGASKNQPRKPNLPPSLQSLDLAKLRQSNWKTIWG